MKPVVGRFAVVLLLFAVWIGYLAYLVLEKGQPVVLSRPQFLEAQLTVIAEINSSPKEIKSVTVSEIRGPQRKPEASVWEAFPKPGEAITISNLAKSQGWSRPGSYILPLVAEDKDKKTYRIAPVPPPRLPYRVETEWPQHWIYLDTSDTRSQMDDLVTQR